ncbi:uncharacterized protein LOC141906398 [Tubulanus polymorphus]|uniref:uncharacterized protein LOC141906398 n=1 Tax=Tubulanus polymorphus TaxID=672921 RepID=UPI003DA38A29
MECETRKDYFHYYHDIYGDCERAWARKRMYGIYTRKMMRNYGGTWVCKYNDIVLASVEVPVIDGPDEAEIAVASTRFKWDRDAVDRTIIVERGHELVLICNGDYSYVLKPLIYNWIREEGPISVEPVRIDNKSKLVFPAIAVNDSGRYMCYKENRAGYDERDITVKVFCKNDRKKLVPCDKPPNIYTPASRLIRKYFIGDKAEFKIFYHQMNTDDVTDLFCGTADRPLFRGCRVSKKRVVRVRPTNWGVRRGKKEFYGQRRIRIEAITLDDYRNYSCYLQNTTTLLRSYFNIQLIAPGKDDH